MLILRYIFNERIIIQLILGVLFVAFFLLERKKDFIFKSIFGFCCVFLIAFVYNIVFSELLSDRSLLFILINVLGNIVFVPAMVFFYVKLCFKSTIGEMLFVSIAAYVIQQLSYVLHFGIFGTIFPILPSNYIINNVLTYVTLAAVLTIVYFLLLRNMSKLNIKKASENKSVLFLIYLLIAIVIAFDILVRHLNSRAEAYIVLIVLIIDAICCTIVLILQFNIIKVVNLNNEIEVLTQLFYEKQKQYEISKENIDIINLKCHDLKHQIQMFKKLDKKDSQAYLDDIENSVMIYDSVIKTDNDVINTVLSEKALYCEKNEIKLSHIVDTKYLDHIKTVDLYTFLGNALDNAIEGVKRIADHEKRIVSLTITTQNEFISIQVMNYFDGNIEFVDGIPQSSKNDRLNHGYGYKSMSRVIRTYGGNLSINTKDGIFTLQAVIPIESDA